MSSKKQPAFMFYPGDYQKDPAVRACTISARGLLVELFCFMHESPKRGMLMLPNGRPMSIEQLARMCGVGIDDTETLVQELIDTEVISITPDGVLFSRRMVRDENSKMAMVEGGRKGGHRKQINKEKKAKRLGSSVGSGVGLPLAKARASISISTSTSTSEEEEYVSADEYEVLEKDPGVQAVMSCIPKGRRKNFRRLHKRIEISLEALKKEGVTDLEVVPILSEKITAYYASPEGMSEYHRSPIRWLNDHGWKEHEDVWNSRDNSAKEF